MPTSGLSSNYIPSSSTTASRYGLGAYRSGALSGSSHSNGLSETWSNSVSQSLCFLLSISKSRNFLNFC